MKRLLCAIIMLVTAAPLAANDFIYHGSFLWNGIRAVVHRDSLLFCAFHDGVGAINLNRDFTKKKLYAALEIPGGPARLHRFGDLLVVEGEDLRVTLVDISDPLQMVNMGSFDPEWEIYDIAVLGSYLYAAVEYDGIVRYDISDPGAVFFDDSSMAGIKVTHLDVYESRLYGLDSYNGLLIYEPDAEGFGAPVSRLLLPKQAISFAVDDDTVYAGMHPSGYMIGDVVDVYNPHYIGERSSFIRGDLIAPVPQGIVLANSINGFELIYSRDSLVDQLFPLTDIMGYPTVFMYQERAFISYPSTLRGFVAYDIEDPVQTDTDFPDYIYAYPGPITQVAFINSRLHVIGTNNWYEMYDISDPSRPLRTGKMINPPWKPAGVCTKGDTLFVADKATNTFFPALDHGAGDPDWVYPYFSVSDSVTRPRLIPRYFPDFGGMDLLYFHNTNQINGSARNDSVIIPNKYRWSFPTGVAAAVFDGPRLYRISNKGTFFSYTIDRLGQLEELIHFDIPKQMSDMVQVDTILYMLGSGLRVYSVANPAAPRLLHSDAAVGTGFELTLVDSWLVCAGRQGIHIYDIFTGIPQPLFSGGDEAVTAAYFDHQLAASDGYSVKLYTTPQVDVDDHPPLAYQLTAPRLRGYPNPFNPTITLHVENFQRFGKPVHVEVYDILGRRVSRLTIQPDASGDGQVLWGGVNDDGESLPSGVYLFRARQDAYEAVFKAVLLK